VTFFPPIRTYINFCIVLGQFLVKHLWEDFHPVYKLLHDCLENHAQPGERRDEL